MQEEITGVALPEGEEPMLVVRVTGTMAQMLETIKSLAEHAGDKDIGYLVKHPVIRLERR